MRSKHMNLLLAMAALSGAGIMEAFGRTPSRQPLDNLKKPRADLLQQRQNNAEVAAWNAAVDAKKAERKNRRMEAKGRALRDVPETGHV